MNQKKAIVLGGTSPHIELIKKLKSRDYFVILVDYLNNSPGIPFADKFVRESTLDLEKVYQVAKEENADLVISTCIDQANSTCCYVAEKLGLPHPYSYETSLDVTDKGRMKTIMRDNDIPTSSFQIVTSLDEVDWDLVSYPAVVKPVDCNSSKGVIKVDNQEDAAKCILDDIAMSRTSNAIIEGYNEGYEIQVDCLNYKSKTRVLMTRRKKRIESSEKMVLNSTGSIIPAGLSEELNEQAQEIANKISDSFNLKNTPFFYQAIVTENGISVIEFAPRIGGGLSSYLIKEIAGVDVVDVAIDSFLNIEIDIDEPKAIDRCYSTNLLYMKAGIFDHIEGFDELKTKGFVKEVFTTKEAGTEIDSDMRSSNRVGAFIVMADNVEDLKRHEKIAYETIQVMNDKNENVIKLL